MKTKKMVSQRKLELQTIRYHKRRSAGLCTKCTKNKALHGRPVCMVCAEYYRKVSARSYEKAKNNCLDAYGHKCACCGEKTRKFLTFDHMFNNGAEHRRTVDSKSMPYWLVNNKFPDGFQVLCYNCNLGRDKNGGICPHKENSQ